MIPKAYILEWNQQVPWHTMEQVEQDLVICRALVELFSDDLLARSLAFRGGTALHKLYINPPQRYSEDIDLVQITAEPFGTIANRIRERLSFLGEPKRSPKAHNFTMYFKFESDIPPTTNLRLKVETNTREHFTVSNLTKMPFEVNSKWFNGSCNINTYKLEELLGTKLRALYQRKKGRDLYDLYIALTRYPSLDKGLLLKCYREYMNFSVDNPPSRNEFILNMEAKINDPEFLGDTAGLLRKGKSYEPLLAYELVKTELIENI
ncbi:MAG: nucleotidyl transferase AbiEii/AbiGii toxin family protein [Bacteroidales bacterium]|jgi:predicted nucleotidyltransferase component of viral defense system|nr:nucleotidyl transferase AbiEii/AbiGii toxin family protein [Bacteroidales bacterium]MDD3209496.1 nucleotidyl transferase AbiEii/AbiGii toxin family protein [Bacteroidales bacterium]MDD3698078.1 nucleotidyl transferase AbiEii/AbiGii toxin family protein [Bacteroidales bacterium]MDD4168644.1 nucleotidyl transferase AbiEii/AbiGii toxin family protein [Bacteroidales bacterium]MDD4474054.1 nucleotidyl transferase AbiEii/AbiGii toxin family protein [Bacteroidales bacterium]